MLQKIEIIPTITNNGKEFNGWLIWRVQDIQVNMTNESDILVVNNDTYSLNETIDVEYDNNVYGKKWQVRDTTSNEVIDFWWDTNITIDDVSYAQNYTLKIANETGQYNAPIEFWTYIESLPKYSTFSTTFLWHDAMWDSALIIDFDHDSGNPFTAEILNGSSDKPGFSGTLTKFAVRVVIDVGNNMDNGDGITCDHCETSGCSDTYTIGSLVHPSPDMDAETTYWINNTDSALLSRIEHDGADSEFLWCDFVGTDNGGDNLQASIYVHLEYTPPAPTTVSDESTNSTTTFSGDTVNHTATVGSNPTQYLFAWNGSGVGCDTWVNSSWITVSGSSVTAYNASDIPSACKGEMIGWRIWGNNSEGKTAGTIQTYLVYQYGEIHVNMTNPLVDTAVTENSTFFVNSTVQCIGTNAKCGQVVGKVRYNSTGANPDFTIYPNETTPFYVDENEGQWDIITDEGDGTADSSFYFIGDWSDDSYGNSSLKFEPQKSIEADGMTFRIVGQNGPNIDAIINFYICDGFDSAGCNNDGVTCTLVNNSLNYNQIPTSGWVSILFDSPYQVIAGNTYSITFETTGTDGDSSSDYKRMGADTSPASNAAWTILDDSSCLYGSSYGQIILNGSANPKWCGNAGMDEDDICYLNWTVNATFADDEYVIDVYFNSSYGNSNVADNNTGDIMIFNVSAGAADTSFNITWTNDGYTISADGGATASSSGWLNSSDGDSKNVNPTIEGSNAQTTTYALINFTNEGDTAIQVLLWVDSALPSTIKMFGSLDNDPDTNTFSINNSEWAIANASIGIGQSELIWVWANFTDDTAGVDTVNLLINSTAA